MGFVTTTRFAITAKFNRLEWASNKTASSLWFDQTKNPKSSIVELKKKQQHQWVRSVHEKHILKGTIRKNTIGSLCFHQSVNYARGLLELEGTPNRELSPKGGLCSRTFEDFPELNA
jgi:hypothetical protein